MVESEIYGIFPTPIYRSELKRKFTKKEINFFNNIQWKYNKNNTTSADNYVLERPDLSSLKKEINLFVKDYFDKIIFPQPSTSPYITQSWLNCTKEEEGHHAHNHANSYVSGVFYINAEKNKDSISFRDSRYNLLKIISTKQELYNSDTWNFSVKKQDIIIFPSYLTHLVEQKKHKNNRISLSFNVFLKGTLGEAQDLNQLYLT